MSKYYSGQDGKLFIQPSTDTSGIEAADEIAKVRSWSFTLNTAVLETVSLGDFDRTIIPGMSSTTGSCNIYYYSENPNNPSNSGRLSSTIFTTILPKAGNTPSSIERPKVKFRFQVDTNHYLDLNAVLTSLTMTNSVGEVMSAEVNFEGDGIPTEIKY